MKNYIQRIRILHSQSTLGNQLLLLLLLMLTSNNPLLVDLIPFGLLHELCSITNI